MKRFLAPLAALAVLAPPAQSDSTLSQTLVGADRAAGFAGISAGPGEGYSTRADLAADAPLRATRRSSLIYFGQISDFQLADEESPARVEFLDGDPSATASAAWRPNEALAPFIIDYAIRQLNAATESPFIQGDGERAQMVNAVLTGDLADSAQRNETEWVLRLLEGGTLDPNSGTADLAGTACPPGTPLDDPAGYTGVQDYDDAGQSGSFYDPDEPFGNFADWPSYPGLMDRAQQPFEAAGLDVPSYVAFGNHDGLVQGNQSASAPIETVATGCVKPLSTGDPLNPSLETLLVGTASTLVPPDARRQFVDKLQYKSIFASGEQDDGHGFDLVDGAELEASAGAAAYYSWSPLPGIRFIVLDTLSEGGVTAVSANGNVDHPQFLWLEDQLKQATERDEIAIAFAHHAIGSLTADLSDETAGECNSNDAHGHGTDPGCDKDPRDSTPIHLGEDVRDLFLSYPHLIAFVAGHSHNNRIAPYAPADGEKGGFWEIKSPATADWPSQDRVIDVMENCDGTLSIFSAMLDNAAPLDAPAPGSAASALDVAELASVGRLLTYNDPQTNVDDVMGEATDRNVELLLNDPRASRPEDPALSMRAKPRRVRAKRRKRVRFVVRSAGEPVRGAVVRFAGKQKRTNSGGVARFRVKLRKRKRAVATKTIGCTQREAVARVRVKKRRG